MLSVRAYAYECMCAILFVWVCVRVCFVDRNRLLENLLLHGNEITAISADLQQLRSLKVLRLDHNNLSRVENLERLGNLTYLDLSANKISEAKVRSSALLSLSR